MQTQIVAVWFYPCSSAYNASTRTEKKGRIGFSPSAPFLKAGEFYFRSLIEYPLGG